VIRQSLYGGEVIEGSSHGFLPFLEAMLKDTPNQFGARGDRRGHLPLNVRVESCCPPQLHNSETSIQRLVETRPQVASTTNRDGQLPLHLALENGWPFKPTMEAGKQAISTKDILVRMYPFQLDVCSVPVNEYANEEDPSLRSIDVAYTLLLQNPTYGEAAFTFSVAGEKKVTRSEAEEIEISTLIDCLFGVY
jgi:hypothetical protein